MYRLATMHSVTDRQTDRRHERTQVLIIFQHYHVTQLRLVGTYNTGLLLHAS